MIGERSEHTNPIEHPAHGQTAYRSQRQGDKQGDPHIVQALEGQHAGQLPAAHAHGLEHTELLLAGEQIGNERICEVNQGKDEDKNQNAVVSYQFSPQAALQLGG